MKWNEISLPISSGILQTHTSLPLHLHHSSVTGNCKFSKLKHFKSKRRIKCKNTHLQSILPCMSRSSKWPLPFRLSNHKFLQSSPTSLIHARWPTHFIVLHLNVLLQCPGQIRASSYNLQTCSSSKWICPSVNNRRNSSRLT